MNIKKLNIWTLTDGSQGMISQTRGLANELSEQITEIKTDVIFPWNKLQPGILPIYKWIFKNTFSNNVPPEILISCGRKSVYLSIYLKKKYPKIINIHIQNPKVSTKYFTFIIAPNHDNFKGKNVINSIGALHYFKNTSYSKKQNNKENRNLISCIIGGANKHYTFTSNEAKILCKKIKDIKKNYPKFDFLIITSRRTNNEIKKVLENELKSMAKIWLGDGNNPYEFALYNSEFFIITSDSTSMISEASISGMPIYVFQLPYKRKSIRFDRFHNEFKRLNITKDLISTNDLQKWTYSKIDESKRIAGIIKERIIEGLYESR